MSIVEEQKKICEKYQANFLESLPEKKIGISLNVKKGEYPIHGLRHSQEGDTTGWYIWSGDYSDDPEFVKPLHVEHIDDWNPLIKKYLGLAPGWRFLITPDYEDVWQDLSLLEVQPDNGFAEKPKTVKLEKGSTFDRYGYANGSYASPVGTPAANRLLAPGTTSKPLTQYEVLKPIDVSSGTAAPWFNQPGGGTQYKFNSSMQQLLDDGYIKEK